MRGDDKRAARVKPRRLEWVDGWGYFVFLVLCFAFAVLLMFAVAPPMSSAIYFDEKAAAHCSPVCHVNQAARYCVDRCPGASCQCVRGAGGLWYFNETIGGVDD